jgi:hypothetical protein
MVKPRDWIGYVARAHLGYVARAHPEYRRRVLKHERAFVLGRLRDRQRLWTLEWWSSEVVRDPQR